MRIEKVSNRLYALLIREIEGRRSANDTRFYSERELSTRYDIARLTARRLIQRLASHGYLRQEPGRGTFLVSPDSPARERTHCILLLTDSSGAAQSHADTAIIGPLQTLAAENGYHVILSSTHRPEGRRFISYQHLVEKQKADGIVLLSVDERVQQWFNGRGYPCVVLGSTGANIALPRARCRDECYFEPAVRHLKELGHRRIAFVAMRPTLTGRLLRLQSYERAAREYGLENVGSCFIGATANEESACRRITRRLLGLPDPPTAIVTGRITQAAHVLSELTRQAISVPRDMSLISGSDSEIASLLQPKLTTVCEPVQEVLSGAWNFLRDQLCGRNVRGSESVFESHLAIRESTAGL